MGIYESVAEEEKRPKWIEYLIDRLGVSVAEQIIHTLQGESEEKELGRREGRRLIERFVAKLDTEFVTGQRVVVLRTEMRRKIPEMIEGLIEELINSETEAARAVQRKMNEELNLDKLFCQAVERVEDLILWVASQIRTKRPPWTEAFLSWQSYKAFGQPLTAADQKVAKLARELNDVNATLSYVIGQRDQLEKENKILMKCREKGDSLQDGDMVANAMPGNGELKWELETINEKFFFVMKRCAQLEEENINLKKSHEKGDSLKDGDLVDPNSASSSNSNVVVVTEEPLMEREVVDPNSVSSPNSNVVVVTEEPPVEREVVDPNSVSSSNSNVVVVTEEPPVEREVVDPNSMSSNNSNADVVTGPLVGREVTRKHSATTEELKEATKFSYYASGFAGSCIVGLLIFHFENKSGEPHTLAFKALTFVILANLAYGLSIILLPICAPAASYQMQIIRDLVSATRVFLGLSGVGVCIALMKAKGVLVFVLVIVVVIVACIKVYCKKTERYDLISTEMTDVLLTNSHV